MVKTRLHCDVAPQKQLLCQETRNVEKRVISSPYCCVRNKLTWFLVTLTVVRGERKAVMRNSATARSRKRLATRTYSSHTAPFRCGVQETFQENGPTYVDSSHHRIQTVSGRYVDTARSKPIAMFSAFDPPSKVATMRLGSTFYTATLGWSTITVLATLSAPSMTTDKARKEAILMNTCNHSVVQRNVSPRRQHVVPGGGRFHRGV